MKGAIFLGFASYIEQEYDLTTWLKAVNKCELGSNAEYLDTELYEDSEFNALVDELVLLTRVTKEELVRNFGRYFFPTLMSIAHTHVEGVDELFDFLRAVDAVIHIEVQKSDPLAYTPTLLYDQPNESVLIMRYVSRRKMCYFAEGLILGAADHFKQKVQISQTQCMCKGDQHCLIRIQQL
ncbi:heme NO-binding domain-containing protein [Thalassotalea atypica]|uniref:heme NO-binding domain-containing protein n=1 Tax=Thalassotalea atypica TaxID=2054316 RepID=UPI002572E92F|nr:heme NO-binding domain-containing protein [Thalassotalea atypica]